MKKYIAVIVAVSILVVAGLGVFIWASVSGDGDVSTPLETASVGNLSFPSDDFTKDLGESIIFSDGEEILITQSGTYEFTGDYTKSTITVNVDKDTDEGVVYLVMNDANIYSEDSTPVNIIEAKDVVIVLSGDNTITQGQITTTDTEFPSAALYSKADTVITGQGSLTVETLYQDGINSRDDLIIDGTNITVNAVEDGIVGKDFLAIRDTAINLEVGKDGIKSSNDEDLEKGNLLIVSGTFNIDAENDGISSENILQIDDGDFEISSGGGYTGVIKTPSSGGMGIDTGGGFNPHQSPGEEGMTDEEFEEEDDDLILDESMKGIKAVNYITINGGTFNISSYEDTVHSNGDVIINGGDFTINAGDDGFHGDNIVTVTGGNINVENCFEGIEGVVVNISGGDIIINTNDDGINGSSDTGGINISGGDIEIYFAVGGDGIDSNGYYTQTGGDIVITATSYSDANNAPLDVDGTVTMSGGTIVDEDGNDVEATGQGGGGDRPTQEGGPSQMPGGQGRP